MCLYLLLCKQLYTSTAAVVLSSWSSSDQNLPLEAGQPVSALDFCTILLTVFKQVYRTFPLLPFEPESPSSFAST